MRRLLKNLSWRLIAIFLGFLALRAAATTYYVDINSTNPTPPYTNWSTASTDIQSAVNQATNGDFVFGKPGSLPVKWLCAAPDGSLTAVVVTNAVTIQGVNGQATTSINGANIMRCLYLGNGTALARLHVNKRNCSQWWRLVLRIN